MKRVVLLSQCFPPETYAGANRLGPMADALARRFDLCVVALMPSYPTPEGYRHVSVAEHDAGLPYEVRRIPAFAPHKGSLPVRSVREQAMAARLAARALPGPVDAVIASSPSMFLGPAGLALARLKGASFVWDVRDVIWGYARDAARTSRAMTLAARTLEHYMVGVVRRADLVIGASTGITRALEDSGARRTLTAPNGISAEMLEAIARGTADAPANKRPVVSYAGLVGFNQGLEPFIEAAATVPDADFVVAGDGPELQMLRRRAVQLGASNVHFRGYLDRESLLRLYGESDILFAQTKGAPTIEASMVPVKLFEYMAAGKPIVFAGRGLAAELLDGLGCAAVVPQRDADSISAAVCGLLADSATMRRLGLNGKAAVQEGFRREEIMAELAEALEEHLAPNSHESRREKLAEETAQ